VRALDDIVTDICYWLRPDPKARAEVLVQIRFVEEVAKRPPRPSDIKAMRTRKKKAQAAVAFISEEYGDVFAPPWLSRAADAPIPDPRFDHLRWFCALAACTLIAGYGTSAPVGTEEGNVHAVTKLIHEAVTGEPSSDDSCRKAVKSVLQWRRAPIST
jgi:hypothetical protein